MSALREMRSALAQAKASSLEFCRPTPAERPPSGPGWIHEIKQDGFRMMVRRDGERVRLLTKNSYNWSARYPGIVAAAKALKCTSCVIDGEVIVGAANGLADFNALRSGRQCKDDAAIYAFDLLMLDGEDLRRQPIEQRKAKLKGLLNRTAPWLQCADFIDDVDGPIVFEHACKLGCEGIVSKRKGSLYRSGRSRDWIKAKNPNSIAVKREAQEDWSRQLAGRSSKRLTLRRIAAEG